MNIFGRAISELSRLKFYFYRIKMEARNRVDDLFLLPNMWLREETREVGKNHNILNTKNMASTVTCPTQYMGMGQKVTQLSSSWPLAILKEKRQVAKDYFTYLLLRSEREKEKEEPNHNNQFKNSSTSPELYFLLVIEWDRYIFISVVITYI